MREIAGISFEENTKTSGEFLVSGTDYKLPFTIICGKNPGKTVLITAGVHGCEYVGIQALVEIQHEFDPEKVNGTIIIIPVVNRTGFESRIPTLVREDLKNLNRVFPGNPQGTESERLAYFMTTKLYPECDYYLDLHSGSMYEDLSNYVYFVGACDEDVSQKAKEIADLCDVPYLVKSFSTTGAYNYAGVTGIPSILLERGGCGKWTKEEVAADKKDICNMLSFIGSIDTPIVKKKEESIVLEQPLYICVSNSGLWYTELKAGDDVIRGQELGHISDYLGNVIERVYAEHDGKVLYLTRTLWADKDTEVVTYAKLCGGEECHEENHIHTDVKSNPYGHSHGDGCVCRECKEK